jgi:hypothetical protein
MDAKVVLTVWLQLLQLLLCVSTFWCVQPTALRKYMAFHRIPEVPGSTNEQLAVTVARYAFCVFPSCKTHVELAVCTGCLHGVGVFCALLPLGHCRHFNDECKRTDERSSISSFVTYVRRRPAFRLCFQVWGSRNEL